MESSVARTSSTDTEIARDHKAAPAKRHASNSWKYDMPTRNGAIGCGSHRASLRSFEASHTFSEHSKPGIHLNPSSATAEAHEMSHHRAPLQPIQAGGYTHAASMMRGEDPAGSKQASALDGEVRAAFLSTPPRSASLCVWHMQNGTAVF